MSKDMQIHVTSGDWAAIYVDGKFEDQGHESTIYEKALSLFNVEFVYDPAFMRGDSSGRSTAKTTEDIEEYKRTRDERRAQARDIRLKMAEMEKEASSLENFNE